MVAGLIHHRGAEFFHHEVTKDAKGGGRMVASCSRDPIKRGSIWTIAMEIVCL